MHFFPFPSLLSLPPRLPSDVILPADQFSRMSLGETSPWELPQLPFLDFDSPTPLLSISDSDPFLSPASVIAGHVSEDMDQTRTKPGSEESTRAAPIIDDRKRRRMISNRESARRSRMRKQNHIENLRSQLNWLRLENLQLSNHLRVAQLNYDRQRIETGRLQSEQIVLRQKLSELNQIVIFQQLQQFSTGSPYINSILSEPNPTHNYVINNMINT